MKTQIKQVHFQITRNCNLRCPFCGQWGKKGFFADSSGEAMSIEDWKRIISELESYGNRMGEMPTVTVWGGEPLVSPYFDEILTLLNEKGFRTEVITNGVLINEHSEVIKNCVRRLYVSLDGPQSVHDAIRGEGVFGTVKANLKALNHPCVTIMSVITPGLVSSLPQFLTELKEFNIKELYLQDMIGLSRDEIEEYKKWMKDAFDISATDINSWENNELKVFNDEVDRHLDTNYGYRIEHKTHTSDCSMVCKSAYNHPHIAWNGNVLYCTDFYDFSAGNVKTDTLENIFNNEKSERYRSEIADGKCPSCNHCSWRTRDIWNI